MRHTCLGDNAATSVVTSIAILCRGWDSRRRGWRRRGATSPPWPTRAPRRSDAPPDRQLYHSLTTTTRTLMDGL